MTDRHVIVRSPMPPPRRRRSGAAGGRRGLLSAALGIGAAWSLVPSRLLAQTSAPAPAAGTAPAATAATAQSFPSRAIRLVIPSTPGGGTDFIGRTLSTRLGDSAGWTVVPENRPGAAGTVGLAEVARARPDGHELVIGQAANVSLAPWLMKLGFDPIKDLLPIAIAVEAPMVLTVVAESPFRTWQEFVQAAQAASAKPMNFGTSGTGSVAQIAGIQVGEASGFRLQHIPYKGSAPALADLIGGHVDLAGTSVTSALSLLQSGKVRALAVTSRKRSMILPEVPALAEIGYPSMHLVEWYGVFAPAGIDPALADRLNAEVNKVLQRPDVRTAIAAQGQDLRSESRQAFDAMVKADSRNSQTVITKAGIKLE